MSSHASATPLALKIALWVAAVGNVLWAIPSPLGLFWGVLFTLGGLEALVFGEATVTGNLGAGLTMLLFTGGGLYLLAGYWRPAFGGSPAAPGRRFWWLSAAFNVTVAGVCAVFIVTDAHPIPVVVLVWTAVMVVLSLVAGLSVPGEAPGDPSPVQEPA